MVEIRGDTNPSVTMQSHSDIWETNRRAAVRRREAPPLCTIGKLIIGTFGPSYKRKLEGRGRQATESRPMKSSVTDKAEACRDALSGRI